MKDKDYITVYWSPGAYIPEVESWSMLYQEPAHVLSSYNKIKNKESSIALLRCPAHTGLMKNVFKVDNLLENHTIIPNEVHKEQELKNQDNYGPPSIYNNLGKLQVKVERATSYTGYTNLILNMSWLFFADEPVVIRVTAPYFPAVSPGEGVILAAGEYDIGSWYRKINLDYHVPYTTTSLDFKVDQSLFYLEFKTTKKIVFKRYILTQELDNISKEVSTSPLTHGLFKPLSERYSLFKKAALKEQILKHIKDNLIE